VTFVSRGPGKARYRTQDRPARTQASVFSEFYRKNGSARLRTATRKARVNSIITISGFYPFYTYVPGGGRG
jgi:hypothetical protein